MDTASSQPRTLLLIHGLFMTPLCWEKFADRYTGRGHRVLVPSWPGLDGDVESLRRNPTPVAGLALTRIVDHYDQLIRGLDEPPALIGHSFGGLVVQLLLDRGLGAAGVAIDPAAPKGVLRIPYSTLRSTWPVLSNPANRSRAVPLTLAQFRYAFANTLSEPDARAAYQRYAIPGSGRMLFDGALANLNPRAASTVTFRNGDRPPLLLVAGGRDHIIPPSLVRATARKYRHSAAVTDLKEFPGRSHFLIGEDGWQEIADYVEGWLQRLPLAV